MLVYIYIYIQADPEKKQIKSENNKSVTGANLGFGGSDTRLNHLNY